DSGDVVGLRTEWCGFPERWCEKVKGWILPLLFRYESMSRRFRVRIRRRRELGWMWRWAAVRLWSPSHWRQAARINWRLVSATEFWRAPGGSGGEPESSTVSGRSSG